MTRTRRILTTRTNEIDSFLDLLSATDDPGSQVSCPTSLRAIAETERSILRATVLLLLYNLSEAVCRSLIEDLRDEVVLNKIRFKTASKTLRETWLAMEWKNRKGIRDDNAVKIILDLIDFSQSKRPVIIDTDLLFDSLSGNVDISVLKEIGERFGFNHLPRESLREGIELARVKHQRNQLGHGNTSFSQCGGGFSLRDLQTLRDGVVQTLSDVVDNAERFVLSRGYAAR